MHKLHEVKVNLCKGIEEFAGQKLTAANIDELDKLARTAKNIGKLIKMAEESEYSGEYSGGYSSRYSGKRDSMGRYSRDHEIVSKLRDLQNRAPDEATRQTYDKLITMVDGM